MKTEEKKEYNYVQFPLCLIRETYKDVAEGAELILCFGIMNYAIKLKYDLREVARQLAYSYYKRKKFLQSSLADKIDKAIKETGRWYKRPVVALYHFSITRESDKSTI